MTHETQNVACRHAIAARTALGVFRHQQAEAGLDWSSFDTAVGHLDHAIEEQRSLVRKLQPALIAAVGFPAAIAYSLEEIQAADGPDMEVCHQDIDAEEIPPEWKRAAVRITRELLANACRHSKEERLFLELSLDGDVLRMHVRDWGAGFQPDGKAPERSGLSGTRGPLELIGGTATIDREPGKGTCVNVEIPLVQQGDA